MDTVDIVWNIFGNSKYQFVMILIPLSQDEFFSLRSSNILLATDSKASNRNKAAQQNVELLTQIISSGSLTCAMRGNKASVSHCEPPSRHGLRRFRNIKFKQ